MLGSKEIKISFDISSVTYEKTLILKNYNYENNYNKKIYRLRRDIRTGTKKQVYKGNEKTFKYELLNVTENEWYNFYIKMKDLTSINYQPHTDNENIYTCYLEKMEFSLLTESSEIGKIDFEFKTNAYQDNVIAFWILETGFWNNSGIWKNNGLWNF